MRGLFHVRFCTWDFPKIISKKFRNSIDGSKGYPYNSFHQLNKQNETKGSKK